MISKSAEIILVFSIGLRDCPIKLKEIVIVEIITTMNY